MWLDSIPVAAEGLRSFEEAFRFKIDSDFKQYLAERNGGMPMDGRFPTAVKERKLAQLLDFTDMRSNNGAWAVNKRMRKRIGVKRIVIGIDPANNYICLERNYREQFVVVYNLWSCDFERSLLDLSAFMRAIG